ncbi:hypothetical protein CFC21_047527 [Triticum aestivum]|uniref:Trichome birefringence-like N-terminal domain-containing protein n=4 Tax=Triticinae TaxID=1648030 RepID=A0A9R1FXT9_WHEAT|nr:hypothetical protein CFC21_047527 [Triticum aestivum]
MNSSKQVWGHFKYSELSPSAHSSDYRAQLAMVLLIKLLFVPATVFLSALIILSYFTSAPYLSYSNLPYYGSYFSRIPKCDISQGEWVPDADTPPHYTNETCSYIQEHQNCMKYGRPDSEFLRWRWQPSRCDLPRFDADKFFRLVGNKTLAFVGDSLARNHMQSLLCLLSKVASPTEVTERTDPVKIMHYERYNFTLKIIWSPFLVRTEEPDNNSGVFKLYLDEPDDRWFSGVAGFDYVILSGANWFTRQSMFYERGQLVGGSFVALNITSNLTLRYSHRMAFRTALRAINDHGSVKAKVIVRTLSPMSHFEGGSWDKGGDCRRTQPYRSNETTMGDLDLDFYTGQVEEFREAEKAAAVAGVDMVLMDTTGAMLLRPDGHPSRYGHWPEEKRVLSNDCIHWCLPGPVDAWNDMLLQIMSD